MTEKDNTTIYRKLIKSKIFFILFIPVLLGLLAGIFQEIYYRYKVNGELNKLNNEITALNEQKNGLSNLLDYYKDELNIEKEARVRLNLKKEGENVVIILPQATSTGESSESISGSVGGNTQNFPNYLQWGYYFFGK